MYIHSTLARYFFVDAGLGLKRSSEMMTGYLAPLDGSTSMALLTAAAIAESAQGDISLLLVLCESHADDSVDAQCSLCTLAEMLYSKADNSLDRYEEERMEVQGEIAKCKSEV